jgi:protein O-GlcNAc transferase
VIAGLIEQHDRRRFDVIGYSCGSDDANAIRSRLAGAFDRFVDIRETSDRRAAELIQADAVDILIDLTGYTAYGRTAVLAHRPAPLQASYIGYSGTMGADFIDYIIVDRFLVPPDQQPFFSERLVHLPDCYLCTDDKREVPERTPTRAESGLPEAGFVFCCFNNAFKITPAFFDVWRRLLRAVPGSVLWLLDANPLARANLAREATARGVAPERIVFAPRRPVAEHLARHRLADLFLDTLPYNAHVTTCDALWAGLPVLTCAGHTFAGRVAGSLLHAIGLDELVTPTLDEYEALARRLACEPQLLAQLRARLLQNRQTHALFDTARFTRNIEAAYQQMWETWKAGRPPAAFSVSPHADS